MKNLNTFEEFLNESVNNFKISDFPVGTKVHLNDEVWLVVKPGSRGDKVFMAPFNREAKERYISIAIEFDLNWLNGSVTKIDKK